jgi:hypothetical protein
VKDGRTRAIAIAATFAARGLANVRDVQDRRATRSSWPKIENRKRLWQSRTRRNGNRLLLDFQS